MAQKKTFRNWLPLPQLPTSSPASQQTAAENYIFAGASAPPIFLTTDLSSDFDYENDFDGGNIVTSVLSATEKVPLAVKQGRDVENENDLSSDFNNENDFDDGDVMTSVLSGAGQAPSSVKQRRDVEKENDLSSDFDYENNFDGGNVVTSVFSATEKMPSAVKQGRDVEKENDLSSDFDYENDYDDGGVVTSMLSETEKVPSAVKHRRETEKQKEIYMFAGASAAPPFPQTDSLSNLDDENDYDDGGIVTSMLSGTKQASLAVRETKKQSDPKSTRGKDCGRRLSVVILYFLVVLCFAMWAVFFYLFLVKYSALSEELKAINQNHSEMLMAVKKDLDYVQATQKIMERTVSNNISELQDITASICVRVDVSSSHSCPHRWKFHGKNCYYFSTEKKNWTSALWYCIQNRSFLVSIWSDTEQGFLRDSINNTGTYWLGVTDVERDGHWKWKEGDLFATTAFWNPWASTKDNNQNCGIMHPNGTWAPAVCSLPNQWICKKKVIC